SSSRRSRHTASGTMTSAPGGTGGQPSPAPASSRRQGSLAIILSLMMSAIHAFLERVDAVTPYHVDEALRLALAPLQVDANQLLDHVGNLLARERRADHLADRRRRARPGQPLVAADGDLVPLVAVFVDAEDADVADVVVAARVHAAGDVEIELADVVHVVEPVEPFLDRLRHRDRLGVGGRAQVAARASGDVGDEADVRRGESQRSGPAA